MLFMLGSLAVTINVVIQFARGTLDKNLLHKRGPRQARPAPSPSPASGEDLVKGSSISVNKIGMVSRSVIKRNTNNNPPPVESNRQVEEEEEEGGLCNGIQKAINRFNWFFAIPMFVLLMLITGANFPFSFTLFFIVCTLMLMFPVARLHRKLCDIPILWVLLESLFLVAALFWALNHWTIENRIYQPYFLLEGTA